MGLAVSGLNFPGYAAMSASDALYASSIPANPPASYLAFSSGYAANDAKLPSAYRKPGGRVVPAIGMGVPIMA